MNTFPAFSFRMYRELRRRAKKRNAPMDVPGDVPKFEMGKLPIWADLKMRVAFLKGRDSEVKTDGLQPGGFARWVIAKS